MAGHINVRVHNRKTLEVKLEYIPSGDPEESDYHIDLLLYIPDNVGINQATYEKRYFYTDLFRSIRLKSPDYLLNSYYGRLKSFADECKGALNDKKCRYQFKKFITGYRSMLRNNAGAIGKTSIPADIDFLLSNVHRIRSVFRKLNKHFGEDFHMFMLADEFTSVVTTVYLVRLYERLGGGNAKVFDTIKSELKYRKKHFPKSLTGDDEQNSRLISRYDFLKGYFYDVLSLRAKRKVGDKAVKNMLYATAAGISMVIATGVAFWAQQAYGNFTLPFFVALVVGYMFKDRIKEGTRSLFDKLASPVTYDYITQVYESSGTIPMGKTWERAGFVNGHKLPDYIEPKPDEKRHILHFNKKVHIFNKRIKELLDPDIHGISDIMRLNINRFISGLEEPMALVYSVHENHLEKTYAEKIYDIEVFLRVEAGGHIETIKGILTLTAKGIRNFRII